MTFEMWYTLAILSIAIILFISEWLRLDIVAVCVVLALMLGGILSTDEALAGFSNSAVITIAALFVVGGAIMQTGLAQILGQRILAIAGTQYMRLSSVIMATVALMSGFMSNTGTVAVLLPAIVSLARSARISAAKLLMPLAFAASLGGAATLIGTPPNLIVNDVLKEANLRPFGFFEFTPLAFILLIFGVVYMLFWGRRLLPDDQARQDIQRVDTPEVLFKQYRLPDNLFRLRVRRNSGLVEQSLFESGLRDLYKIDVLEIIRQAQARPLVQLGRQKLVLQSETSETIQPDSETQFRIDDILLVRAQANDVQHAAAFLNLGVQPAEVEDEQNLISAEVGVAEVVLPPRSSLLAKSLSQIRFGTLYHLTVLGIARPNEDDLLDLKTTPLQFGDTLLVQGAWRDILALKDSPNDFIVIGQPEVMQIAPNRQKAPLALLVLLTMLLLIITKVVSITAASLLAALAVVFFGCLSIDEAYEAVDWKSIVLIAGMLPMSTALVKVGLVDLASLWLTQSLGNFGPLAIMAGLFLLTAVFTQVLSNTATTVLIAPVALITAQKLGIQPYAFLMAIALAASQSFASPVASPVNTLVMGAGNYRFSDYMKIGIPLILINLVVSILLLPLFFPLS